MLIQLLLRTGFVSNTPQEIAKFVRIYKNNFDPVEIGDYLGEGGKTEMEMLFFNQIRYWYTRAVSFVEMELEPALRYSIHPVYIDHLLTICRLFLTGCGFRLPGEGQKVLLFL